MLQRESETKREREREIEIEDNGPVPIPKRILHVICFEHLGNLRDVHRPAQPSHTFLTLSSLSKVTAVEM